MKYLLLLLIFTSCSVDKQKEIVVTKNQTVYNICNIVVGVVRNSVYRDLVNLRQNFHWNSCKSKMSLVESNIMQKEFCSKELREMGNIK